MLVFPQLLTGSVTQYPIRKVRLERTVINRLEGGDYFGLPDPNAGLIRWELRFEALADAEVQQLTDFYQACEGALQTFTFLDPFSNLFVFSEDQTQPAWQRNQLLQLGSGLLDALGGSNGHRLTNTAEATLAITQTVPLPGSITCAFSVYMRAASPVTCSLARIDGSTVRTIQVQLTPTWNRYFLTSVFPSSISTHCDFSLSIPSGQTIEVFGFQLDAQPYPGQYVSTLSQSGVYPQSRFGQDELVIVSTGPDQSHAATSVVSRSNS